MSNITRTNYLTNILQSANVHISFLKTKKPPSWPPLSQGLVKVCQSFLGTRN